MVERFLQILDFDGSFCFSIPNQGNFTKEEFLPEEIRGKILYQPQDNVREKEASEMLKKWWKDFYKY